MNQEPAENERKEAPEELPEVEPASGQDRVHPITVRPLEVIPIHPVVVFEVADDRLDRRPSFQPSPNRRVLFPRQVMASQKVPRGQFLEKQGFFFTFLLTSHAWLR